MSWHLESWVNITHMTLVVAATSVGTFSRMQTALGTHFTVAVAPNKKCKTVFQLLYWWQLLYGIYSWCNNMWTWCHCYIEAILIYSNKEVKTLKVRIWKHSISRYCGLHYKKPFFPQMSVSEYKSFSLHLTSGCSPCNRLLVIYRKISSQIMLQSPSPTFHCQVL